MPNVKVAVIPSPGAAVELREMAEPQLEEGAALLAVECSEVCGTDTHLQQGRLAGVPYPLIPGHVTVGRLEKIRGRVVDVDGKVFREGDRVTFLDVHRTCQRCWYCSVAKAGTRCPERKVYGITYGAADGLFGGWAEKVHLQAGTRWLALGDVPATAFMAGGCGLPTAIHAVQRGEVSLCDRVLVLGSGPVGLSAIILARARGAARVLCIGAPAGRIEVARAVGAHDTLDFTDRSETERLEWVLARTDGRGADVVIEATGAPEAVVQAMRFARDAGRVVVVGQYTDHGEARFNPHLDLNKKHLDVRGCWGSDYSHFHLAVTVMREPELAAPWSRIPVRTFDLAEVGQALDAVASGAAVKALVVPRRAT